MTNLQMKCEKNGYLIFNYKGRRVHIRILNMGIEKKVVRQKIISGKYNKIKQQIKRQLKGRIQLLSIEESTLHSIILKLKAFKLLLKRNKNQINDKIHYLLIINEEYFYSSDILKITKLITRIQERFGKEIIELKLTPMKMTEKFAYMACSDIFYVISLRDKINLNVFEYMIANKNGKIMLDTLTSIASFAQENIYRSNP